MANSPPTLDDIGEILDQAREAAVAYSNLTGRPLGITGEVGEYEAARLLNLTLAEAREPGFDATDTKGGRYQIKTRSLSQTARRRSQQIGGIKLDRDWDAVLLVLLDEAFQPLEIWQAGRAKITEAITAPGSKARNERGALAVSKLKSIGRKLWPIT